jgi:Cof subfamily protein (haloacid dehalogenase superfamily)
MHVRTLRSWSHDAVVTYRALALDLDGTLLLPDGTVSAENRRQVAAAVGAGWHVVLATARWHQQAERIAHDLGLRDPIIACSGAEVRRLSDGKDLFDHRLPAAFAVELFQLCDSINGTMYAYQDHDVLIRSPDATARTDRSEVRVVRDLADAEPNPRCVLAWGDLAVAVAENLAPVWKDEVRFLNSMSGRGGPPILTLTGHGADKGVALRIACADLNIDPSAVVAFGDSDADIEMFRVAGASVAMGQASAKVQDAATWTTASNTQDGVAQAIERIMAGKDGA